MDTTSGETASKTEELEKRVHAIKNKIAIYSGKGGVGKTTVAVNIAVTLAKKGHSVGFLDADIDCPNAHVLFGIKERAILKDGKFMPPEKYGVRVVSMGMLTEGNKAMLWRGPMLTKALRDLLFLSEWGDIDYLIIDLPPGTSDVPLTIIQTLDVNGFLAVTTPQSLALGDTLRSINMIKSLGKQIIGVVENMCGGVFGCSYDKKYMVHIPLDKAIAESCDEGTPIVLKNKAVKEIFDEIADKIENHSLL